MYKGIPYWNIALCGPDPQCDYMGGTKTHFCHVIIQYGVLLEWSSLYTTRFIS